MNKLVFLIRICQIFKSRLPKRNKGNMMFRIRFVFVVMLGEIWSLISNHFLFKDFSLLISSLSLPYSPSYILTSKPPFSFSSYFILPFSSSFPSFFLFSFLPSFFTLNVPNWSKLNLKCWVYFLRIKYGENFKNNSQFTEEVRGKHFSS